MSSINTVPLKNATIMKMYAEKDEIQLDPEYQRMGNIWGIEKKQLLIDSIINDYDIPKIYFHELDIKKGKYHSSVIDGRQRLEAIWEFIDDKFPLANDFKYFKDTGLELQSLKYSELAAKYPKLRINFDSVTLPIILVQTDDIDLIEDMFSRLNEAVPLNAPEKRNAIGGNMVEAVRKLALTDFFTSKLKLNNNRFQHLEIAVKFLYLEDCFVNKMYVIDTSKPFLDRFVVKYKSNFMEMVTNYYNNTLEVLGKLNQIFSSKDNLLTRQGDLPIYYILVKDAIGQDLLHNITKEKLVLFRDMMSITNKKAPEELSDDDYMYYDYYLNSLQGTNNSASIRARVRILETYFNIDYSKSLINVQKNI